MYITEHLILAVLSPSV